MNSFLRSRAVRIVGSILIVLAVFGFGIWRMLQPRIRTATLAEVESVLPKELLEVDPPDPVAEKRMQGWASLISFARTNGMPGGPPGKEDLGILQDPKKPTAARLKIAQSLFRDEKLKQLNAFLNAGPVRIKSSPIRQLTVDEYNKAMTSGIGFENYSAAKSVEKSLCISAELLAAAGDRKHAIQCLFTGLKFDDRFMDMKGLVIQYLVAIAVDAIAMRTIERYAADAKTSPDECRRLLSLIPISTESDTYLAATLKKEFQAMMLPRLPDPYFGWTGFEQQSDPDVKLSQEDPAEGSVRSSYDALETSRKAGAIVLGNIRNATRALKDHDPMPLREQNAAGAGLPQAPDEEMPDGFSKKWSWFKYRYFANQTHNFFGRVILSTYLAGEEIFSASLRQRTLRNAVRILLATRIYRASHGGALPKSRSELVPILGSWPIDLYDGSPMRYDAAKEVVYSVGMDLTDDGGDVRRVEVSGGFSKPGKDDGVSLAIRP